MTSGRATSYEAQIRQVCGVAHDCSHTGCSVVHDTSMVTCVSNVSAVNVQTAHHAQQHNNETRSYGIYLPSICQVLDLLEQHLAAAGTSKANLLSVGTHALHWCSLEQPNIFAQLGCCASDQAALRRSSYTSHWHVDGKLACGLNCTAMLMQVRVFLKDIVVGGPVFNELWRKWLGPPETAALPTRTTIQADLFDPDNLVEVDAVAAVPKPAAPMHVQDAAMIAAPGHGGLRAHRSGSAWSWRPDAWANAVQSFLTNGYVLTFAFLAAVAAARVRPGGRRR